MDGLRVIALGGVFLVHVGMVFNPFEAWHIQNPERSRVVGELVVLMAPWVMPLFMLLAGVSAWYSLQRRSNAGFVRERTRRILLPLGVGVLLLVPPQVYVERRLYGEFGGSLFAFYPRLFDGLYPEGNFSWHHLWFLGHLFVYSIVALPLFRFWQRERGRLQLRRVAGWVRGRGGLLWLAAPLVLQRSLLWVFFRDHDLFTTDWSNQALLFVAFLYGFALAAEPDFGKQVDAEWRWAAAAALLATGTLGWLAWSGYIPTHLPEPYSPGYVLFWVLYAVGAWSWIIALLGVGRLWIRGSGTFMSYAGKHGYAWYVLHQTVIVVGAYFVVQTDAPVLLKFLALLVASAVVTVVGAELLARMDVVGRLLGARSERPRSEVQVGAPGAVPPRRGRGVF